VTSCLTCGSTIPRPDAACECCGAAPFATRPTEPGSVRGEAEQPHAPLGSPAPNWPGTHAEWLALARIVQRDCTCVEPCDAEAHEHLLCPAHRVFQDEVTLKRLIFCRRLAAALRRSEWMVRRGH
jgi:hypothetical protein